VLREQPAAYFSMRSYGDHASILKFIERNWDLDPLTTSSRDNLPNPIATPANPYVPVNMPAIGDLFDMFDFEHPRNFHRRPFLQRLDRRGALEDLARFRTGSAPMGLRCGDFRGVGSNEGGTGHRLFFAFGWSDAA